MCQPYENAKQEQNKLTQQVDCLDGRIFPQIMASLISKDHQQRHPFCCILCYNHQIYIKIDPGFDRLFFTFLPDWYLHKRNKTKFWLKLKEKKKKAPVSSNLEVKLQQHYVLQSDIIKGKSSRNNCCLTVVKTLVINYTDLTLKYRFHCNTTAIYKYLALKRNC